MHNDRLVLKPLRGKRHSRWNAIKHGILASDLLIVSVGGEEEFREFERLAGAL